MSRRKVEHDIFEQCSHINLAPYVPDPVFYQSFLQYSTVARIDDLPDDLRQCVSWACKDAADRQRGV